MSFYGIRPYEGSAEDRGCCIRPDPIITYDATVTAAYTFNLAANTSYLFTALVICRGFTGVESGSWTVSVHVKRGTGNAEIQGHVFQGSSRETHKSLDANWTVSGQNVLLTVKGLAATTIKWQPLVDRDDVSW